MSNFLFEEAEEIEFEKENITEKSEFCISKIYSFIKKINGIKYINICKSYSYREDDGRKEKRVELQLKDNGDIEEVLSEIYEKLEPIFDIKIEEIEDGTKERFYGPENSSEKICKNIRLCLCKKFAVEKIEAKILPQIQQSSQIPFEAVGISDIMNKIIPT
jgi:hypothetical protein